MSQPNKTESETIKSECPRCLRFGRSEDCSICIRDKDGKTTGQCGLAHCVKWLLENPEEV